MAYLYSVATEHASTSRAVFFEGGQYAGGVSPVADKVLIRTDANGASVVVAVFNGLASRGSVTEAEYAAAALNEKEATV
jgi:hypothetical protein